MSVDVTTSDRVWPKSGLWAASFRVMFPLASLWAVVCVGLWQWGHSVWPNLELPLAWHIHEMTFGFGGAAVAGYLLTACSSWTGRAPVNGWPLMVLASLWVATRACLLWPHPFLSPVAAALLSATVFWVLAGLLIVEAKHGGKQWRISFVLFALAAGMGSGFWTYAMLTETLPVWVMTLPILGFAVLLISVGGQIVPAFLARHAILRDAYVREEAWWFAPFSYVTLALAFLAMLSETPEVAGGLLRLTGLLVLARLASWTLGSALRDGLLAMLVLSYLWLPAGLILWGHALIDRGPLSQAEAIHILIMGGMGGLIMAVSARSVALRTSQGMKPRRGTFVAFALICGAVWARMFAALDLAAVLWCAGWLLYLIVFLPGLRGPVPRPVFSGARNT